MGWNWTINPGAKDMITGKIADITLTLKATDYLHIPPTTTMDVDVHLSIKSAKEYKELHKNSILKLKEDKEVVGVNAAALIGKLQQFTGGACYDEHKRTLVFHGFKLLALADLIRSIKEPVLVLTMYKHETDRILRMITGAEEFSETSLDRWNKKKIPVLVADPRSIGTGLNLQEGGRHLIWYSLTYSRLLYDQTNARLIRTGQTHETFIHRLMCPNTVDWAVAEALRVKGTEQDGLKTALQSLEYIR
jgi:SNF2 family DNA or RNA helicase